MHFFVFFRASGGSCDLFGFPIVWNACRNAGGALFRSETVVGRILQSGCSRAGLDPLVVYYDQRRSGAPRRRAR
eukprot:5739598-Prymnesium_polylepis.1